MVKPLPWSASHYDQFKTCPRQFHAVRVAKTVPWSESEQQRWGNYVHAEFEKRQKGNKPPLPDDLKQHEKFMQELDDLPGERWAEKSVGLNVRLQACDFFDKSVWYRAKIDFLQINGEEANIIDYKTGKQHSKFDQLEMNALQTFIEHPQVEYAVVKYYWTTSKSCTGKIVHRDDAAELWRKFMPTLKQMKTAYQADVWQPRPSGLCKAWCDVLDCEFNGRRK